MAKIQCNVISYVLKRTVDITVVVPTPTFPETLNKENPPKHHPKALYPVIYLLHGYGNNHMQWTGYTNAELYAEEHNVIVVNPSGENKFYGENGDDYFTFISKELPDFICGCFPASGRPEDTYIAGLSMGGYGTIIHALNHPERFCAFGAFSAAVGNLDMLTAMHMAVPQGDMYDPDKLIQKVVDNKETFPKVYMACGTEDPLFELDKAYCNALKEAGADTTWDEIEGYGHEWRFWDIEFEKFLKWIPRTDAYAKDGPRQI